MPTVPVSDGKTLRATGPVAFLASALLVLGCGCDHPVAQALHPANVAHELRPHRLWRKNQNRPLSENAYFSVPPSAEINSAAPAASNSSATATPSDSAASPVPASISEQDSTR